MQLVKIKLELCVSDGPGWSDKLGRALNACPDIKAWEMNGDWVADSTPVAKPDAPRVKRKYTRHVKPPHTPPQLSGTTVRHEAKDGTIVETRK